MVKKIIFFLAWIGIFLLSIIAMAYVVTPNYFLTIDTSTFVFKVVLFNIGLIYLIICILKLSSNFKKSEDYQIQTESGMIHISRDTVKKYIKGILSEDHDIKESKIECETKGKSFNVKINLEILSDISIIEKTEKLQSIIKTRLEDKLNIKADKVEIKVSKFSAQKNQ